MEILVSGNQMKQCDKNTIEHFGVPSLALMERAALGVVEEVDRYFQEREQNFQRAFRNIENTDGDFPKKNQRRWSVLAVCGRGNNGGDGLAISRMLWQRGYHVTIVMPSGTGNLSKETKIQKEILSKYGILIQDVAPEQDFDVIIDALFGIGLTRNLEGIYREYLLEMNGKAGLKVAVDIPSGIHADTGEVMGIGFQADITVTFAFAKPGLLLYPGAEYAGKVLVKDIGIDVHSFLEEKPSLYCVGQEDLVWIPNRLAYSNKGSFGKVLTVAGQKNMAGSAFLSGKASYVTGAGLVRIFTEDANRIILQQLLPEAILTTYEGTKSLIELLSEAIGWASVIVAGPGIGSGKGAKKLVKIILQQANVPVILDADGLNVVAESKEWLKDAKAPVIVTPHLGEMARLIGKGISEIQKHLVQTAYDFAKEYHVICVLKDARTVTALPNGRIYINTSGNSGMATAGAGDVLTGVLAGLIGQGMKPELAAPIGVYLHGAAGDKKVKETGAYGMLAQDMIDGIRVVLKEKEGKNEFLSQSVCGNQSGCSAS